MIGTFPTHCSKDQEIEIKITEIRAINEKQSSLFFFLHSGALQTNELQMQSNKVVYLAKYGQGVHVQCAKAFISNI